MDARAPARLRRPRRHGAAVLAPARRGRRDRRPAGDHRQRADRRPGQPRGAAGGRRHARARRRRRGPAGRARRRGARGPGSGGRRLRRRRPARRRRPRRARGRRRAHAPRSVGERRARAAVLRPHRRRARRAARRSRGGPPMTTAALTAPALAGRDTAPPLGRLMFVELRKMTDTRAGFWLQLAVIALTLAIAGILVGFGESDDQTFEVMLAAAMQPSVNLLPVIGILLVSSECSQRTAQQTFTLVPRRPRVICAKLLASLAVAAAAFAISILVALLATAIAGSDAPDAWSLPAGQLVQMGLIFAL